MTQSDDLRPLDIDDYRRTYVVMLALRAKAIHGDERPMWEILHDLHEQYISNAEPHLEGLLGDDGPLREVTFGLVVLERLLQGRFDVPSSTGEQLGNQRQCAQPQCREMTSGRYCLHHELES